MKKIYSFLIFSGVLITVRAQASQLSAASGEYIVKYKNASMQNSATAHLHSDVSVKKIYKGSNMIHVKIKSEAALQALRNNTALEFVEPNYTMQLNSFTSTEPELPIDADGEYLQTNSAMQVTESWSILLSVAEAPKTIVAVIDTGLARLHPLFRASGAVWENTTELNGLSGVDDDGNGFIDDLYGWNFIDNNADIADNHSHGTHVAGIVLGAGQNIFAAQPEEAKIKLMPVKFINSSGTGYMADAVSAIFYAVDNGARVINNSWGINAYSKALAEAYTYAHEHGVVIVSAAGNSNENNDDQPFFPANFTTPNNISVLATQDDDKKAPFSNYAPHSVNLGAPGVNVWSLALGGSFSSKSGSSMAAPFVAGLAALIRRESPQLSPYQVKNIIVASVDIVPELNGLAQSKGRANAFKSIILAQKQTGVLPYSPANGINSSPPLQATLPVGCGLVKTKQNGAGGFFLLLLPLFLAFFLRSIKNFQMNYIKIFLLLISLNAQALASITEADLSRCEKNSDCIIVPYRHCCGSTKRAINRKYKELYASKIEWQKFDDPKACNLSAK